MTKVITALIVLIVCWIAWIGYQKWESVDSEQGKSQADVEAAERAAQQSFNPRTLPGMQDKLKDTLESTLEKSQTSAPTLKQWLKTYQKFVEDPRLAWIQLDYVVLVSQTDPVEAKKVFHEVEDRLSPTSPVYPRLKQLQKTYE